MTHEEKLRFFRKKQGLTQKDLAQKAEVSEYFVRQLEAGKKKPTPDVIGKIADALGIGKELLQEENGTVSGEVLFRAEGKLCSGGEAVVGLETWPYGIGNPSHKRTVLYDDYVHALAQGKTINHVVRLGILPKNVVSISLSDDMKRIAVFIPASQRPLVFTKSLTPFLIPYPNMIMVIEVTEKAIYPKWCLCLKDTEWPENNEPLYRFPFGNVSISGGICMGGNSVEVTPDDTIYDIVNKAVNLFFITPYNGDYYGVMNMVTVGDSLEDLLKKLDKKDHFPQELLQPANTTLEQLLKSAM